MMKPDLIPWKCLIDAPPNRDQPKSCINKPNPNSNNNVYTIPQTVAPSNKIPRISKTTSNKDPNSSIMIQQNTKTFAQAVSSYCDIPSSQLPQPVLKGDNYSITIPEEEYNVGLHTCTYNLHARILWPKGSIPPTVYALHAKLLILWKDLSR